MRKSKKLMTTVVSFLLTLVMLLGTLLPSVAETVEGIANWKTIEDTLEETVLGDVAGGTDTGWLEIVYGTDENGKQYVDVILSPTKDELMSVTKAELVSILTAVIDAAKTLVVEQIMNSWKDANLPDDPTDDGGLGNADSGSIWEIALGLYMDHAGYAGETNEEKYLAFFEDIVKKDSAVEALVTFVRDKINLAVRLGLVSVDELKSITADKLTNQMTDIVNEYVDNYAKENIGSYINYDKLDAAIKNYFESYGTDKPFVPTDLIEEKIVEKIADVLGNKANRDEYVNEYLKSLLTDYFNGVAIDPAVKAEIETELKEMLLGEYYDEVKEAISDDLMDEIKERLENDTDFKERVIDSLTQKIKDDEEFEAEIIEKFTAQIIPTVIAEAAEVADDAIAEYISYYKGDLDTLTYDEKGYRKFIYDELDKLLVQEIRAAFPSTSYPYVDFTIEKMDKIREYDLLDYKPEVMEAINAELNYVDGDGRNYIDRAIDLHYDVIEAEVKKQLEIKLRSPDYDAEIKAEIEARFDDFFNDELATEIDKVFGEEIDAEIKEEIEKIFDGTHDVVAEMKKYVDEATLKEKIESIDVASFGFTDEKVNELIDTYLPSYFADAANRAKVIDEFLDGKTVEEYALENYETYKDYAFEYALDEKFGITPDEFTARLAYIAGKLAAAAAEEAEYFESLPTAPKLDVKQLLKEIESVAIDGNVLVSVDRDGVPSISFDALKALIADIPTPGEILDMDKLALDWFVEIDTALGDTAFSVGIELTTFDDEIKKAIKLIVDHLDVTASDGTVTVDVRLPEAVSDILRRAANTEKVPTALKKKIFKLLTATPAEFIELYASITIEDVVRIVEAVDIERLVNNKYVDKVTGKLMDNPYVDKALQNKLVDYIRNYVSIPELDGEDVDKVLEFVQNLTNENVRDYVMNKEWLFDKFMTKSTSYLEKLENKLPENYQENLTFLSMFYEGAEKFGFYQSFSFDLYEIELELRRNLPERFAEYENVLIFVMGEIRSRLGDLVDFTVDVNVSVPDVSKITFVTGEDVYLEGVLPAGALISNFIDLKSYDDRAILAWVDENGEEVKYMPDGEITLYAVLSEFPMAQFGVQFDGFTADGYNAYFYYDGAEHTITAYPDVEGLDYSDIVIKWYKGSVSEENLVAEGASITLSSIADAGEYYYTVTLNDNVKFDPKYYESEAITVEVLAPIVENDVSVNVTVTDKDGNVVDASNIVYDKDAEYTFTANVTVADYTPENLPFGSLSYQWYVSSTADFANATKIEGATAPTYKVSGEAQAEKYYFCEVTYEYDTVTVSAVGTVGFGVGKVTIDVSSFWLAGIQPVYKYDGKKVQVYDEEAVKAYEGIIDVYEADDCVQVGHHYVKITLLDTDNYVLVENGKEVTSSTVEFVIIPTLKFTHGAGAVKGIYDPEVSYDLNDYIGVYLDGTTGIDGVQIVWTKEGGNGEYVDVTSLKNVVDSGVYNVHVTYEAEGVVQRAGVSFNFIISPKTITIRVADDWWNVVTDFTYNNANHTVDPTAWQVNEKISSLVGLNYKFDTKNLLPGDYDVDVAIALTDAAYEDPNYVYELSADTHILTYTVKHAAFDYGKLEWYVTDGVTEQPIADALVDGKLPIGKTYTVYLGGFVNVYNDIVIKYSGTTTAQYPTGNGGYTTYVESISVVTANGDEVSLDTCYEETGFLSADGLTWDISGNKLIFGDYAVIDPRGKLLGYELAVTEKTVDGVRKIIGSSVYDVYTEIILTIVDPFTGNKVTVPAVEYIVVVPALSGYDFITYLDGTAAEFAQHTANADGTISFTTDGGAFGKTYAWAKPYKAPDPEPPVYDGIHKTDDESVIVLDLNTTLENYYMNVTVSD